MNPQVVEVLLEIATSLRRIADAVDREQALCGYGTDAVTVPNITILAESADSVYVRREEDPPMWIPRTHIIKIDRVRGRVTMAEWMARRGGLLRAKT